MPVTMRELVTKWGFEVDQKPLQQMGMNIFLMKESLQAFYELARGVWDMTFGLAKGAGEYSQNIEDLAARFNISTTRLQEWQLAASQAGVGAQQFTMAMQHLEDQAVAASEGNQSAIETFQRFGGQEIWMDKLTGGVKDMHALLLSVADAFAKWPDKSSLAAESAKLLGMRTDQLVVLLQKGPDAIEKMLDADEKWVWMNKQKISAGAEFNSKLLELQFILQQMKNTIGVELMPALLEVFREFERFLMSKEGRDFITKDLPEALRDIVSLLKILIPLMKEFRMDYEAFKAVTPGVGLITSIRRATSPEGQRATGEFYSRASGDAQVRMYWRLLDSISGGKAEGKPVTIHLHDHTSITLHGTHEQMIQEIKNQIHQAHGLHLRELQRELKRLEL